MIVKERFEKLAKKYYYDESRAEDVSQFIKKRCQHVEGEWAGQPFELLPFQWEDIIKPVFGLLKYKGGPRLINECYIEIPKKNGKTTLLAAIEIYMLFGDGEPGAQVYNCAGDDSQADLLFRTAKHMIINDHVLKSNSRQLRTEVHYQNRFIKKLTSKAETKHGLNSHAIIYDELHAAQDRDLYDTLKYAGSQRRQPLFFQITTAGYDKTSICWDRHEYTRKILEGVNEDDNFWGVIYAANEADDFLIESTWNESNPMYKYSDTFRQHFKKDAQEAKNNVTVENAFKRLRLNIWTGSEEKWIRAEDWEKGNQQIPDLDGRVCYGGLDLASTMDTTAFVLLFPIDDKYYIKPFVFVPEDMINNRDRKNDTFYFKWAKEGYMIRTPGNVTDYAFVRKTINECLEKYDLKSIGFDPWNAKQLMVEWAEQDGLTLNEYRQGIHTMSEPTKEFERLLVNGKIVHGGHPVLTWMADNAQLQRDNNDNYRVAKGNISKDKVDGIIAAIMALGEAKRYEVEYSGPMMMAI